MNKDKGKEISKSTTKKTQILKPKKAIKRIVFWIVLSTISTCISIYCILFIFPTLPISAGPIAKMQAYAFSSRKIVYKALLKQDTKIKGSTSQQIVSEIVKARTKNNYLYTGGHYTDFYIRNLGTFANKLLDPSAAKTPEEWIERVKLVMRSTELALGVFQEYDEITTTIVQLENGKYVPINIYVEPSDSLASLLKVIYQLQNIDVNVYTFNVTEEQSTQLKTIKQQAFAIESRYEKFLVNQSDLFIAKYVDNDGFIKRNVTLSGIKDSWIRKSSLYDNVMLWSVYHYAHELGLKSEWKSNASQMKTRILTTRWSEDAGIFYDEDPNSSCKPLSNSSQCSPYFSADNLITYEMGMLDPQNDNDKYYLKKILTYIDQNKLNNPFPLKTTEIRLPSKEHIPVRLFAPNYTGTTIWSYWGMVYIDLLNTIGEIDNNASYTSEAQKYLKEYESRIIKYQGFPELYDDKGNEYRLVFYRSVNDMVWGIYYLYLENKVETASTSS